MCVGVCVFYVCVCVFVISRVHAHRGCGHSSTNHSKWLLLLALSPVFSALGQYLIRLPLSFSGLSAPGGALCRTVWPRMRGSCCCFSLAFPPLICRS